MTPTSPPAGIMPSICLQWVHQVAKLYAPWTLFLTIDGECGSKHGIPDVMLAVLSYAINPATIGFCGNTSTADFRNKKHEVVRKDTVRCFAWTEPQFMWLVRFGHRPSCVLACGWGFVSGPIIKIFIIMMNTNTGMAKHNVTTILPKHPLRMYFFIHMHSHNNITNIIIQPVYCNCVT